MRSSTSCTRLGVSSRLQPSAKVRAELLIPSVALTSTPSSRRFVAFLISPSHDALIKWAADSRLQLLPISRAATPNMIIATTTFSFMAFCSHLNPLVSKFGGLLGPFFYLFVPCRNIDHVWN